MEWIIILGVVLGFYVQTVVGFAASLVALPILLTKLTIQEAVSLMSIFFVLFSIVLIYKNWSDIKKKTVLEMAAGIIVGLLLGLFILKIGSPVILKQLLGVFILLYVGHTYLKQTFSVKGFGWLFGFFSGIFSGLFSTGGPLIVMYVHNTLKRKDFIRATIIGALGVSNFLRVPLLIVADLLTKEIFVLSLYVLPFFLLSLWLGNRTYNHINEKVFKKALMILLVLSGISLLI